MLASGDLVHDKREHLKVHWPEEAARRNFQSCSGGCFQTCSICTPKTGEIQFDDIIFQMGWFNHQLVFSSGLEPPTDLDSRLRFLSGVGS